MTIFKIWKWPQYKLCILHTLQVKSAHAHNGPVSLRTWNSLTAEWNQNHASSLLWTLGVWLSVTYDTICHFLANVYLRVLRSYLRLFELTGDVSQSLSVIALLGEFEQLTLLRLIAKNTRIYSHKLQEPRGLFRVTINVSTTCRTLHKMGVVEE